VFPQFGILDPKNTSAEFLRITIWWDAISLDYTIMWDTGMVCVLIDKKYIIHAENNFIIWQNLYRHGGRGWKHLHGGSFSRRPPYSLNQ
jgi:hypothetical protein